MARGWSPERGAVIRCLPCSLSCPRCGPVCSLLSRPPLHTGVTLLPLGREQALTGPQLSAVYRAGLGWEVGDRRQGAQEAGDKAEGQETRAFFQNLNNLTGKKECDWHCGGVTRTSSITGSQSVMSGLPGGSEVKASACNAGDLGLIPKLGRSHGERNGNPLQYSCLENPMDRGAWWATQSMRSQELDTT